MSARRYGFVCEQFADLIRQADNLPHLVLQLVLSTIQQVLLTPKARLYALP